MREHRLMLLRRARAGLFERSPTPRPSFPRAWAFGTNGFGRCLKPVRYHALFVAGLVAIGCSKQPWHGLPRHVEIVRPIGAVSLKKYALQQFPGEYALTFEVVGHCEDCSEDERVDLTVQPQTKRSSYVGRAVKEVVHGSWAADVFVGDNQGNRLAVGDQLDIEAIVRQENDLVIIEGRGPEQEPQIRGRAKATVVVRGMP